jgi:phage terminase small subunit
VKRRPAKNKPNAERTPLNARQRAFVAAYLENGGNAVQAAYKAGYKCASYSAAGVQGHTALKCFKVRAAIEEALSKAGMGQEEVVRRLAEQARANPAQFFDKKWRLNRKQVDKNGHLIRKLKAPSRGKPAEIELHDGQAALVKIGLHLGMFNEKVQHVGDTGGPIRHEFTVHVVGGPEGGPASTVRATGPKAALPDAQPIDVEVAEAEGGQP